MGRQDYLLLNMHTRGTVVPETETEARERYERLGPVAQTVVREVAKAMAFDRQEYGERVTAEVVERARNAMFGSELAVTVGTREDFEDWSADYDGEVTVFGNEHVDNVAWHEAGFGAAVATTFQHEEDAAVETLRRQAFGHLYRDVV